MGNLTDKQRRFVNAYATNGHNGTAAAREAGYAEPDASLAQAASRLLKVVKIRQALDAVVGKAIQKADRGAIADLAEALEHTSATMRRGGADTPLGNQHLGLNAAGMLLKHYGDQDSGARAQGVLAHVLQNMPAEVITAIAKGMLSGNGNGHGRAIEVKATVVK